jgi:hypothetical protein
MNHGPSRFRPCLETLEERALLAVSVSFTPNGPAGSLVIDARQSPARTFIVISNNGNGHITGTIAGDDNGAGPLNGGNGFFNVRSVLVYGGPAGAAVSYFQSGDQVYGGPGAFLGFQFETVFAGGNNNFAADFEGNALRAGPVSFTIDGSSGTDTVAVNARGVNILPEVLFSVAAFGSSHGASGGDINFAMDYSGFNRGVLQVQGRADDAAQADFRLNATFLGASNLAAPRGFHATGVRPGDLELFGGSGNSSPEMALSSPGGLPLTGDIFGGPGATACLHTRNVKAYNCRPDALIGAGGLRLGPVVPHL